LIFGLGFGGGLVLLALMFDPEKAAPFHFIKKQGKEEIEAESHHGDLICNLYVTDKKA